MELLKPVHWRSGVAGFISSPMLACVGVTLRRSEAQSSWPQRNVGPCMISWSWWLDRWYRKYIHYYTDTRIQLMRLVMIRQDWVEHHSHRSHSGIVFTIMVDRAMKSWRFLGEKRSSRPRWSGVVNPVMTGVITFGILHDFLAWFFGLF